MWLLFQVHMLCGCHAVATVLHANNWFSVCVVYLHVCGYAPYSSRAFALHAAATDSSTSSSAPATCDFSLDIVSEPAATAAAGATTAAAGAAAGTVTERWLVCNQLGGARATAIANHPDCKHMKFVPWAGVAARISVQSTDTTTDDSGSSSGKSVVEGRAYCFLPLPVSTGLPVHINGYFELSSNRCVIRVLALIVHIFSVVRQCVSSWSLYTRVSGVPACI